MGALQAGWGAGHEPAPFPTFSIFCASEGLGVFSLWCMWPETAL